MPVWTEAGDAVVPLNDTQLHRFLELYGLAKKANGLWGEAMKLQKSGHMASAKENSVMASVIEIVFMQALTSEPEEMQKLIRLACRQMLYLYINRFSRARC